MLLCSNTRSRVSCPNADQTLWKSIAIRGPRTSGSDAFFTNRFLLPGNYGDLIPSPHGVNLPFVKQLFSQVTAFGIFPSWRFYHTSNSLQQLHRRHTNFLKYSVSIWTIAQLVNTFNPIKNNKNKKGNPITKLFINTSGKHYLTPIVENYSSTWKSSWLF